MKRSIVLVLGVAAAPVVSMATVTNFTDGVIIGTQGSVDSTSLIVGDHHANEAHNSSILVGGKSSISSDSYHCGIFGYDSSVYASYGTFSFGYNGVSYQDGSFLAGAGNSAEGNSSNLGRGNIVLGCGNQVFAPVTGDSSGNVLLGIDNNTSVTRSWVLGAGNVGQKNAVILGTYNQSVADSSLIVGTGTYNETTGVANRSNGLVVLQNGTVQIPSGNLQLGGQNALTTSSATTLFTNHLSVNGYLKKSYGSNSSVSNGGIAALGDYATASGYGAFAIGGEASGDGSFALYSGVSGEYSVGLGANVSGNYSSAMGYGASLIGQYSAVVGGEAGVFGNGSIALGFGASVNSDYAAAVGASAHASAYGANAVGNNSQATGEYSSALGAMAHANGVSSTAIGRDTVTEGYYEIATGAFNVPQANPSSSWVGTEHQFVVGNGKGSVYNGTQWVQDRSNAITTLKNGCTALTNKYWNASAPLEVPSNATESSNGDALVVEGHTVLKGKVVVEQTQGDISMGIYN